MCTTFAQAVLPQRCILCDAPSDNAQICPPCDEELPYASASRCPICAIPLPQPEICGECLRDPPAFHTAQAVFDYSYPVDGLLAAYKFSGQITLAQLFAHKLVRRLDCEILPDVIVPMPLHPERLKERGFNQALEIARSVGRELSIPIDSASCERVRATPAQVGLPREERLKNMRGAFYCASNFAGKRVAIIDDVMTSGASANALSKTLRSLAAAEIQVWLVARTKQN